MVTVTSAGENLLTNAVFPSRGLLFFWNAPLGSRLVTGKFSRWSSRSGRDCCWNLRRFHSLPPALR